MRLLVLSNEPGPAAGVLPALELLTHTVRLAPAEASALLDAPECDVLIVDGRRALPQARSLCRLLETTGTTIPVILVVTEGGLPAVQLDWGMDEIVLDHSGPAEVEARLRLARARAAGGTVAADPDGGEIRRGTLLIDEGAYTATLGGRSLDLTFKEFELLKYLAQHPGRVFTRAQLLQQVWGYDYYGGTRTVDVHVRRLRAKLGLESEGLIGTVRNVGYRFVPPSDQDVDDADEEDDPAEAAGRSTSRRRAGDGAGLRR